MLHGATREMLLHAIARVVLVAVMGRVVNKGIFDKRSRSADVNTAQTQSPGFVVEIFPVQTCKA
jgi:hypothetical protein